MTAIPAVGTSAQPAEAPATADRAAAERFAAALTAAVAPARAFPAAGTGRFVTLGQMTTGVAGAVSPSAGLAVGPLSGAVLGSYGLGGPGGTVLDAASKYLGVPYKWGGTDPATGLDCSGFVQRVYADLGISLPRVSVDQSRAGTPVASLDQAQPGDLVFWRGSPNHIGIYAGGGQMIVAPRTGDVVKFQDITRTPHEIRRIL